MNADDLLSVALTDLDALDDGRTRRVSNRRQARRPSRPARVEYLGQKQGRLKSAQERLKSLDPAGKRTYGQRFNAAKTALEAACDAAKLRVERRATTDGDFDVTLPGTSPGWGIAIR